MKVTVSKGQNVAIFTWSDDCEECNYTAIGFTDLEIDHIVESKANMGKNVEGYEVDLEL